MRVCSNYGDVVKIRLFADVLPLVVSSRFIERFDQVLALINKLLTFNGLLTKNLSDYNLVPAGLLLRTGHYQENE
ncbi:hypothetical protein GCM10028774_21310 [Spirosoma jeollabukense]